MFREVKSSHIKAIDHKDGALHITFNNGSVYRYEDKDQKHYNKLCDCESVGKMFYKLGLKHIKD